ncbi:MAG: hypothetical protein OHK0022_08400 [Roseiflexaceae bacterium]
MQIQANHIGAIVIFLMLLAIDGIFMYLSTTVDRTFIAYSGIGFDLLHAFFKSSQLLPLLEDGGEMFTMSALLAVSLVLCTATQSGMRLKHIGGITPGVIGAGVDQQNDGGASYAGDMWR